MKLFVALLLLGLRPTCVLAQDPNLAEADLNYSRWVVAHFHFVVFVSLELEDDKYTRYQYDHYPPDGKSPSCERIKSSEGVFAHQGDQKWLRSGDWGETGKPVSDELTAKLDFYTSGANAMFEQPVNHDLSQGATVWKYVGKKDDKDAKLTEFTYERTRERPHPDGVYPQFTFVKYSGDRDGKLFIAKATGQMRTDDGHHVPFEMQYTYFIKLPPGTVVKYSHEGHVVDTGTVQPDGSEVDVPATNSGK